MFANINRDILILKPKQALFDWVQTVFQDELIKEGPALEHDESNVYLIPEFDHYEGALEFLKDHYLDYMNFELLDWVTDEDTWPDDMSWELFQSFFHISIQSMAFDSMEEPVEKEYFNDEDFYSLN